MFPRVARASLLDSLRFNLFHVVPMGAAGRLPEAAVLGAVGRAATPGPAGSAVRRPAAAHKYHTPFVDLLMLGTRTRLVLDTDGMRHVLEHSPDAYADPKSKREGMSVFQPNAVTISRLPPWIGKPLVQRHGPRRPAPPHRSTNTSSPWCVTRSPRWYARSPTRLVWSDLQVLFERLALRVVFGDRAADDRALLGALDVLMGRANRVLFQRRSAAAFEALYGGIRRYLDAPDPEQPDRRGGRVLLRSQDAWPGKEIPPPEVLKAENQVPHWLFAMKDTLAANTAFAPGARRRTPRSWIAGARRIPAAGAAPTTAADLHTADLWPDVFRKRCASGRRRQCSSARRRVRACSATSTGRGFRCSSGTRRITATRQSY